MKDVHDYITIIALGAYGAYPLALVLYKRVADQLRAVLDNHVRHLERRVKALEDRTQG